MSRGPSDSHLALPRKSGKNEAKEDFLEVFFSRVAATAAAAFSVSSYPGRVLLRRRLWTLLILLLCRLPLDRAQLLHDLVELGALLGLLLLVEGDLLAELAGVGGARGGSRGDRRRTRSTSA